MPNYRRRQEQGASYFFTLVTYRRRPLFDHAPARKMLRHSIDEVSRRWPFEIYATVLLPDHLHCIWTLPQGDDRFPLRWANLKRLFTKSFLEDGGSALPVSRNREKHHERGVWQARYWEHLIRNEAELIGYRDYIHLNPVKHGYVKEPTQWPWSSVHRHLEKGWLEPDWTGWTPIKVPDCGE